MKIITVPHRPRASCDCPTYQSLPVDPCVRREIAPPFSKNPEGALQISADPYKGAGCRTKKAPPSKLSPSSFGPRGAFGDGQKALVRDAWQLALSSREASTLQREREQDRLVRDFVATLEGEDRAFAEAAGLAKPLADVARHVRVDDAETVSPEIIPEAERRGTHNRTHPIPALTHPAIEALEPASCEDLTPGEIAEAHDAFARVLAWLHEATHLVKKGRRCATLIAACRPDLGAHLQPEPGLRAEIVRLFDRAERARLGVVFGRVFTWCRAAPSLSALGLRAAIIAYVIRPTLLDAATNAQLGSPTNSTRQAVNKLVGEFRDTFAGLRAPAMRGELTRAKCRAAQLAAP